MPGLSFILLRLGVKVPNKQILKIIGLIIIIVAILMILPTSTGIINKNDTTPIVLSGSKLINGLAKPYPARDFQNISGWINSKPLSVKQLRGKVILVDFWTYTCVNCLRTLPYLKDWYAKYHDMGLVIVGTHAPFFNFEHEESNVSKAVKDLDIQFPVALDNTLATWRNYYNLACPSYYLIDQKGMVVYKHLSEGDYNITENNIRYLLGLKDPIKVAPDGTAPSARQTPETYLGFSRSTRYSSPEAMAMGTRATYTYPKSLDEGAWGLNGAWTIESEKIISQKSGSALKFKFYGKSITAVMGASKIIKIKILIDGKEIKTRKLRIKDQTLYDLVTLPVATSATLELIAEDPGLEVYVFSFGDCCS